MIASMAVSERIITETMESSQKQPESEATKFSKTVGVSGATVQPQLSQASQEKWRRVGAQISEVLAQLPDNLGRFFSQYKQAIISISFILAAIVTLKVVLAVIDTLNGIPLLKPTLNLVGIGYSTWFVNRYLLKASTRQELFQLIQNFLNK